MYILKYISKFIFDLFLLFRTRINDNKELTKIKKIEKIKCCETYGLYLKQNIGNMSNLNVSIGDKVKEGDIVGIGKKGLVANVCSPISGDVVEIKKIRDLFGTLNECVIIKKDLKIKDKDWIIENEKIFKKKSKDKYIEIIEKAGVVGLSGSVFPSGFKLRCSGSVDTYIVNGCECEPYITADYRLMVERCKEIIDGIKIVADIVKPKEVVVAIEDNKKLAIQEFEKNISKEVNLDFKIRVQIIKTKYPSGSERDLIKKIKGVELKQGQLPKDVSCVVNNVSTIYAIYEAIYKNKPLIERVVTVTGNCILNPKNLLVKIGAPIKDLIEFCGVKKKYNKVIVGGPMMGFSQVDTDGYVTKGTNCIIVNWAKDEKEVRNCIRCGKCVAKCPMRLNPTDIAKRVKKNKIDELKELGILNCYDCGVCSFYCPCNIPLTQYMKEGKIKLREKEVIRC
jgi:Na+-translocating ferredoxin:NAD+ oxidoreductase subunit C